jgi:hypothetical protein
MPQLKKNKAERTKNVAKLFYIYIVTKVKKYETVALIVMRIKILKEKNIFLLILYLYV